MTKPKNSRPANPVWVLLETAEFDDDLQRERPIGAFSDESAAHETREFCQEVAQEAAFYEVVELPLRKVKMSLEAIIRNSSVSDKFAERKKS